MNEHIRETFSRRTKSSSSSLRGDTARVLFLPPKLNPAVRRYYQLEHNATELRPWLRYPEMPSPSEVQDTVQADEDSEVVGLVPNKPMGAWESKESYLEAHYELLREDAVRPLREAVCQIRMTPQANEDAFGAKLGIYERVKFIGYVTSRRGFASHITFSTRRTGKAIQWAQTNRLTPGALVALSPTSDNFNTIVKIATVAARPASGTELNPPELDLFFARPQETEMDPAMEWTMVEARGSLFEASKHVLLALQHMSFEQSPFMEHLVNVVPQIEPPAYLQTNAYLDMSSVSPALEQPVNVLRPWPSSISSELDPSQTEALQRILTHRLAIVQGPPGTGKTFVSVKALQVMLANHQEGDPPIIVACQTNHAVDQILRHVAAFESQFARLGGFSKDEGVIKQRTMHELRRSVAQTPLPGSQSTSAYKRCRSIEKELGILLEPLAMSSTALDPNVLFSYGLLTEAQVSSLADGSSKWVQTELVTDNRARSPFHTWLQDKLLPVPHKPQGEIYDFELEAEEELEMEQLQEQELDNGHADDANEIGLLGETYKLADNFTCARLPDAETKRAIRSLELEQDMWKIPEIYRGAVYRHLQQGLKNVLTRITRPLIEAYDKATKDSHIARLEKDETILREQKLIGMTTTGLNKYRSLIASLRCKIVLIEEAAETLEAPVLTACIPTLEHLILVGDHKQLQPHCNVKDHEGEPWYLNISLFERMVNNKMPMTTLRTQRRMIPEVRRLLRPIYGRVIQDHVSVHARPGVPGMGGINSWFFSHAALETRDQLMSFTNPEEAFMILGFVRYLVKNGTKPHHITIITFYRGQHTLLVRHFRKTGVVIATVDSYQGEENEIVILSTVRSNDAKAIGFLSVDNRTCVALSRARNGFYIFGNACVLDKYRTWHKVIGIMANLRSQHDSVPQIEPVRFDATLPLTCVNHGNRVTISESTDWDGNCGGCQKKCLDMLPCGHRCPQLCHPYNHDTVACFEACAKELACGHKCTEPCCKVCTCSRCPKTKTKGSSQGFSRSSDPSSTSSEHSISSWHAHAAKGPFQCNNVDSSRAEASSNAQNGHPVREEILIEGLDALELVDSSTGQGYSWSLASGKGRREDATSCSEQSLLD